MIAAVSEDSSNPRVVPQDDAGQDDARKHYVAVAVEQIPFLGARTQKVDLEPEVVAQQQQSKDNLAADALREMLRAGEVSINVKVAGEWHVAASLDHPKGAEKDIYSIHWCDSAVPVDRRRVHSHCTHPALYAGRALSLSSDINPVHLQSTACE